jgi:outer membrane biosynthesis protein TonB
VTVDAIGARLSTLTRILAVVLAGLLVVSLGSVLLALHVEDRQTAAEHRNENQRQALCAILSNLPGKRPLPAIEKARDVFARPGHPRDCQPLPNLVKPFKPSPHPSPGPARTVFVVPPDRGGVPESPRPAPRPAPSRTASPRPHPSRTPTPQPSPTPTCWLTHPLRCL